MSSIATSSRASSASRICVALTVAGWLTILGVTLPTVISNEPIQSPGMELQGTPVKAYPG